MTVVGILGGMGPLASARFLETIYRRNLRDAEQKAPVCLVLSDPTVPDRTVALLSGEQEALRHRLQAGVEHLLAAGADRVFVACVTLHAVLDQVPPALRRRVVSLVELTVAELLADPRPRLLLTTSGSRALAVFERHPAWPRVAPCLQRPNGADQDRLHRFIYHLKKGGDPASCCRWLAGLAAVHRVEGLVLGCTELHLLQDRLRRLGGGVLHRATVDPLEIAATRLEEILGTPVPKPDDGERDERHEGHQAAPAGGLAAAAGPAAGAGGAARHRGAGPARGRAAARC